MGGFFPSNPFSMDYSSFPSLDTRISLGGSVTNGASFSETLRSANALELLQREQERERIREEIIAAERIRIKTLEEEVRSVRKDIAIERELRLQRAKPILSLARIDGKVVDIGGAGVPRKELTCDVCHVSVPCEQTMRTHIMGKKHKQKQMEVALKADEVTASEGTSNQSNVVSVESNSKKMAYRVWTCHLCNASMSGDQGVIEHINGKKHRARKGYKFETAAH